MHGVTILILFASAFVFVSTKNVCSLNWAEFKGECLYFAHDSRSWVDAQKDCRSRGAYLAADDNVDKHNFIRQILSVLKSQNIYSFYLGSDDFAFEGQWRWLETGMPVGAFTAWGTGMPQGEAKHNCMMFAWENNDSVWTDEDCYQRRRYICEKQAIDFRNTTSVIG